VSEKPANSEKQGKSVPAIFYRTEARGEPVRDWLKGLFREDRKTHRGGHQNGGIRLAYRDASLQASPRRCLRMRTRLTQNRIARVLFYIDKKGRMVLLHGFIKKTQKTPGEDLDLAKGNKAKHQRGLP
jgi:hypothetical protein